MLQSMGSKKVGHNLATKHSNIILEEKKCVLQKSKSNPSIPQYPGVTVRASEISDYETVHQHTQVDQFSRTSSSIQFSSVSQSCPTLCNPMNCRMPGLPVHNQFPESTQIKSMSIESVMPSNHLILCQPLFLQPSIFAASGSFQMSQLFASGGQSIGVSASTSVLPLNSQD